MSQKRLLVALSFWEGDRTLAHRLARLLADVEPVRTEVFDLLLLARFDTTVDEPTAEYCRQKFDVYTSLSTIRKVGYPAGTFSTWRGCYDWAVEAGRYDAVMTIEADSVPLTEDWAVRVREAWTLQPKVGVMGDLQPPQPTAGFGEHVNGNAVFSTRPAVAKAIQAWSIEADSHPWDLYGYPVWSAFGVNDTRVIQSDFRSSKVTPGYLDRLISKGVAWFHGCKDDSAYDWAKAKFVVSRPSTYVKPSTATQSRDLPFFSYADTVPSVLEQGIGGHILNPESFYDPGAHNFNPSICKVGTVAGIFYRSQPIGSSSVIRFGVLSTDRGSVIRDNLVENLPVWEDGYPSHYEDPRYVEFDGAHFLSFIHSKYGFDESPQKPPAWKQCLVPVTLTSSGKVIAGAPVPLAFKSNTGNFGSFEKNWVFFGEGSRRHFVYKADPHEVVEMPSGKSDRNFINSLSGWKTSWGTPRGGSSPVLVGDRWFSFFHSSVNHPSRQRRYHAGVYSFNAGSHTPDRVTQGPLLTGSERDGFQWKTGDKSWEPIVVFPAGAIYEAGIWTFSVGINDCRCGLFSITHDELLKRMA